MQAAKPLKKPPLPCPIYYPLNSADQMTDTQAPAMPSLKPDRQKPQSRVVAKAPRHWRAAAQNKPSFRDISAEEQEQEQERKKSLISTQTQTVRNAKTPEERVKAEEMLSFLIDREKWRLVRELPPLFSLYQHEDGRWVAMLSSELQAKAIALRAKTHNDKGTEVVVQAVSFLAAAAAFPPGAPGADAFMKALYQALHYGLVPENSEGGLAQRLHAISLADPVSKKKLGEKMKKDLAHAIDVRVKPEGLTARKNAMLVDASAYKVNAASILVEEAAIEGARLLAQQNQVLPTKKSLRDWIEKHHPETRILSKTGWSNLWTDAGLLALPRTPRW